MQILVPMLVLLVSYLSGSIPFGLLIVKLRTGKDIRQVESGRTGGTNAMRAAGVWAGLNCFCRYAQSSGYGLAGTRNYTGQPLD